MFRPFKVIQGHWFWYQSKARMQRLLVRHSNLGPILNRFGDIADFVLLTPPLFYPNLGVLSLDQIAHVGVSVNIVEYSPVTFIFFCFNWKRA